jgi:hypothetical protein
VWGGDREVGGVAQNVCVLVSDGDPERAVGPAAVASGEHGLLHRLGGKRLIRRVNTMATLRWHSASARGLIGSSGGPGWFVRARYGV